MAQTANLLVDEARITSGHAGGQPDLNLKGMGTTVVAAVHWRKSSDNDLPRRRQPRIASERIGQPADRGPPLGARAGAGRFSPRRRPAPIL
jgi:hypothetical protein